MENLEFIVLENKLKNIFVTEAARNKWKKVIPIMGTMLDRKVAKKAGTSTAAVSAVRTKLGIAPVNFPKLCERYGYVEYHI